LASDAAHLPGRLDFLVHFVHLDVLALLLQCEVVIHITPFLLGHQLAICFLRGAGALLILPLTKSIHPWFR
jgi:hypothetical protein